MVVEDRGPEHVGERVHQRDQVAASVKAVRTRSSTVGEPWSYSCRAHGIVEHIPVIVVKGDQRLCACSGERLT